MAERERLARAVHDGVLQVLATCDGAAPSSAARPGSSARLAGEQEFALRTLLTTGPAPVDAKRPPRPRRRAARCSASSRVTRVDARRIRVELPAAAVDELVAVVARRWPTSRVHVGPDAPAWVLLEDLGDGVEISVRDEGPGIPEGRLAAAEAEGRLGVARSMRGRVRDLGGTITCDTGPGTGHRVDHQGAPGGRPRDRRPTARSP